MRTMHNYFFALRPDVEATTRIRRLIRALVRCRPGLDRPIAASRLHVSLNPLVIDEAPMEELAARAAQAMARVRRTPFLVAFDRIAVFGRGRGPRVVVLRSDEGAVGVDLLRSQIHAALADAGLGPRHERPFEPHLTLARGACEAPDAFIDPVRWTVREFVLIHSHVGATRYDIAARFPLTG